MTDTTNGVSALVLVTPRRWIGGLGVVMVLGHNLLDGLDPAQLGVLAQTVHFLHAITPVPMAQHKMLIFLYPLIPWLGVMMIGYGLGDVVRLEPARRTRVLTWTGLAILALLVAIRAANLYGDPRPWTQQSTAVMSTLSFLNANKYPPSLSYLLMTLGPALILLAFIERAPRRIAGPLATFGRVPLFYYLLHLPLIHGLAILLSQIRYGRAPWLFHDMMAQRGTAHPLPTGYGYHLWVVYAVWAAVIIALYPICKGFAGVKRRHRHPLLSYL